VVILFGGVLEGGVDKRKVVDVPSESRASPGAERATTVAELSPVNGVTTQSN
jgi:hypothetical protein